MAKSIQLKDSSNENIYPYALLKEFVLYDNVNGTTGNIVLSDTSNNYKYIEVLYGADSRYNSLKLYKPNNKKFSTFISYVSDDRNSFMYQYSTECIVIDNKINQTYARNNYVYNNTNGNYGSNKYVKIYRVIGYK